MKIIVIGLGNFGSAVAAKLSQNGHEVIAVDSNEEKIESIKDRVTYSLALDCTDINMIKTLPLHDSDIVLVSIGEDFGSSILITAILKKLNVKRIISRAISQIHKTILEAIGINEILNPEEDSADRFVNKVTFKNVIDILNISEEFSVMEVNAPEKLIGKSIADIDLRKNYKINIITIKQDSDDDKNSILGVISSDYILQSNDIMVIFGNNYDLKKWLDKYSI